MFDIGFSEMLVIGVVALIVIGPERLPKVARTLGHMLGRMQRYVNDVKADINREIELEELRKFKEEVEKTAQTFETSVREEVAKTESAFSATAQELTGPVREVEQSIAGVADSAKAALSGGGASGSAGGASAAPATEAPAAPATKT